MGNNIFNYEESLAVARLIWILIFSNFEITRNESDFFQQTLKDFGLTQKEMETSMKLPEDENYAIVRGMTSKKRIECARLLRLAFNTDKNIGRRELSKLNDILKKAELFRSDKKSGQDELEYI